MSARIAPPSLPVGSDWENDAGCYSHRLPAGFLYLLFVLVSCSMGDNAALKVLLLVGGRSIEHDISLASGRAFVNAMDPERVQTTPMVITRDGHWLDAETSTKVLDGSIEPDHSFEQPQALPVEILRNADIVFPLIHGATGEDGKLQGMLELLDIPYVGSGVLASALCMDKAQTRAALGSTGIPMVRHELLTAYEYKLEPDNCLGRCKGLHTPLFVKPACGGSSIGISRVNKYEDLRAAIELAFRYDRRVLVEEGVFAARELEIGIIGNEELWVSSIGEATYSGEFYDFENKYAGNLATVHIPAELPGGLARTIADAASIAYRSLDCAGMARIDFLYQQESSHLVLSELNTLPGFTRCSMFTELWEHSGLPFKELIEELIRLGLDRWHACQAQRDLVLSSAADLRKLCGGL